jgi:N4-bis(aminopropyl)spermidine synthase
MSSIDFRAALYALSDVMINRPAPLRHFDQIYMKIPDMLLQAEVVSRAFEGRRVVFVGDGDAIALTLAHLAEAGILKGRPAGITVLDFDERVVNSVLHFASQHGLAIPISAELYNVADPLPVHHWQKYDAFYTNPPWGASNDGVSVTSFITRGIEAVAGDAVGCIILGDHKDYPWTHTVQGKVQRFCLDRCFRMTEILPEFHRYHLDDSPELTSCSLLIARTGEYQSAYASEPLSQEERARFYGQSAPLEVRYVRDLTGGGKLASRDVSLECY